MASTRRLTAILAADVAGYSRLMGEDEEGTLDRLRAIRREIGDPKIAEHHGRIVKTTGDGLLVEFASVVDAVRCAIEVQRTMSEHNADIPAEQRIEFRIGINLGDIIVEGDDIFGDGVNIAARLEGLAEPGGVLISNTVHDQVRDRLPFAFTDLGEQHVKNIARPVRVYRVRSETVTPQRAAALPLPDRPSIAVLPFQNMSGDPEQEYFVDGMVEEITTAIARLPWLFVIARNSAFTYKGKAVDVRQVARELGVRYVLEGSIRKAGNRVRITGQLIDAATGAHIWADRFDGTLDDIFELQDQVASSVAGAIERFIQIQTTDLPGWHGGADTPALTGFLADAAAHLGAPNQSSGSRASDGGGPAAAAATSPGGGRLSMLKLGFVLFVAVPVAGLAAYLANRPAPPVQPIATLAPFLPAMPTPNVAPSSSPSQVPAGAPRAVEPPASSHPQATPTTAKPTSELAPASRQIGQPIVFDRGKVTFSPAAQSIVGQQILYLTDNPTIAVTVEGYSIDGEGPRDTLQALAELRALQVRRALIQGGINGGRLAVVSNGANATTGAGTADMQDPRVVLTRR